MNTNKPKLFSPIGGDSSSGYYSLSRFVFIIQVIIGTGFFSGFCPLVPGTAGSLVGLIGMALLPANMTVYLIVLFCILLAGTWASEGLSKNWGKDPKQVVIDEIAGTVIVLAPFPKTVFVYVCGFLLFRLLDIVKPYPCRNLEKVHGGFGIMLDDIVAALYCCILLYGLFIFLG